MPVAKTYYNQLLDSLFSEQDELVKVSLQMFEKLGVRVEEEKVNEFILSHPDYPSLVCISDCLKHWEVENVALRVNKQEVDQYPLPMLAHVSGFKIVVRITTEHIFYLNKLGKEVAAVRKEFLSKWDGIALLVQLPGIDPAQKTDTVPKEKEAKISPALFTGLMLAIMAVSAAIFYSQHGFGLFLSYSLLLLLNLAGVLLAAVLVMYQFDKNNPALKRFCGNESADKDCGATLESRYAKLFGRISWSEIGLFYFTGSLLLLLVVPQFTVVAAWLNLLALPYTIFSVGYQKFVIKKWCPLCLAVQAVLVAGSVAALLGGFFQPAFPALTTNVLFTVGLLFLLPAVAWYLVKPFISGYHKSKNSRYELARLKNDPTIFHTILSEQKKITTPPGNLGIILGNPEAKHTIIKVCNPYCAPCARAHEELKELLLTNNVKVQVIFNATTAPEDKRAAPVKHLLAIASRGNQAETEKAMDDWYGSPEKDYEIFAGKYQLNGELKKQDEKIREMAAWCEAADIAFTPSIIINGHLLPESYRIDELKYILREID